MLRRSRPVWLMPLLVLVLVLVLLLLAPQRPPLHQSSP